MKKTLAEIKAEFPEIDKKKQAATKGGDGYVYYDNYGNIVYSTTLPGGVIAHTDSNTPQNFDDNGGYVHISDSVVNMTTTEGNLEQQYVTTYTYWDGAEIVSDRVEVIDFLYALNEVRDFGSHDEDFIMQNYNKPWYMIGDPYSQSDPGNTGGYFTDLDIVNDPNAIGPNGYNAYGYDAYGYDSSGYDINGFNSAGFNEFTGGIYDSNGFDRNGYDKNGFNNIGITADGSNYNSAGFNSSGINEYTGTSYGTDGFDLNGINASGFSVSGINVNTGTPYDDNGLDMYGNDPQGFNAETGINEFTGTIYNVNGVDVNGNNEAGFNVYSGININTGTAYDEDGFDINGNDANGFNGETGINEFTGTMYGLDGRDVNGADSNGFFSSGINALTGTPYGLNGLDKNGNPAPPNTGSDDNTSDPGEIKYFVQPDDGTPLTYSDSDDKVGGDSSKPGKDDPIISIDDDGNLMYSYDNRQSWLRWGPDGMEQISGDGGHTFTDVGHFIQEVLINGNLATEAQRQAAIDIAINYVNIDNPLEDAGQNLYGFGTTPTNLGDPADCSHYISYLITNAGGVDPNQDGPVDPDTGLHSGVYNIENNLRNNQVSLGDLEVGDLVTFRATNTSWPYHIGMVSFIERDAAGNPTVIHYTDSSGHNGPEFNSYTVAANGPYSNVQVHGYYRWNGH